MSGVETTLTVYGDLTLLIVYKQLPRWANWLWLPPSMGDLGIWMGIHLLRMRWTLHTLLHQRHWIWSSGTVALVTLALMRSSSSSIKTWWIAWTSLQTHHSLPSAKPASMGNSTETHFQRRHPPEHHRSSNLSTLMSMVLWRWWRPGDSNTGSHSLTTNHALCASTSWKPKPSGLESDIRVAKSKME